MKRVNLVKPVTVGVVFVVLIGFLVYYSTQNNTSQQKKFSHNFSSIEWLLGRWENQQDSLHFQEVWKVKNSNTLKGDGYLIVGDDTSFHEHLTILMLNNQILYITQFEGQEPTMFHLTNSSGNYLVFENKEHIYPSKITYNQINDSTMTAGLEGKNEYGEFVKREFNYYRTDK